MAFNNTVLAYHDYCCYYSAPSLMSYASLLMMSHSLRHQQQPMRHAYDNKKELEEPAAHVSSAWQLLHTPDWTKRPQQFYPTFLCNFEYQPVAPQQAAGPFACGERAVPSLTSDSNDNNNGLLYRPHGQT